MTVEIYTIKVLIKFASIPIWFGTSNQVRGPLGQIGTRNSAVPVFHQYVTYKFTISLSLCFLTEMKPHYSSDTEGGYRISEMKKWLIANPVLQQFLGNKCKEPSNFQRKGKSNINFLKSNDHWHVGWGNLKYHNGRYLALEISRAPTRHFVRALRCYVKQWQWPGPQSPDDTHCVYRAMFYSGDVRPLVWHSLNINTTQTPASSNIHEVKKTSQTIFSWSCENKQDLNLSP